MQRILVPVDFSTYSINALRTAVHLAKHVKGGSQITLLHVLHYPFHASANLPKSKYEEEKKQARRRIKKIIKELKTEGDADDVNIHTYMLSGLASPTILQAIRKIDCDMVIMGRKGETEIKKLAVGSIAKDVLLHSKIPVMIVSEATNYSSGFNNFLYATDYHHRDVKNLNNIAEFATTFDADITALNITTNGTEQAGKNKFTNQLKEQSKLKNISLKTIKEENVYNGLLNYLRERPASLLVVTRYKKSSFSALNYKKQLQKLLEDSQIPVVVFDGK